MRVRTWWVVALMTFTIATRLPALVHPDTIDDESVYSVVANEIVNGGRPYEHAIERKPPLLFWTYAAVFAVAGPYNWLALHAVAVVWVLLTMAGLFVIGRGVFDPAAGAIAALLYAVFQAWGTAKNLAFNGEVLMNLPIVWAYALVFMPSTSRMRPSLVVAGGLFGVAFLLKQPAAIAAVPAGVYLLLPAYGESRGYRGVDRVAQALQFTAGFVVALGAAAWVLWSQGILADAYYWTITDHTVPHVFLARAVEHSAAFMVAALPLFLPLLAWPLLTQAWRPRRAEWMTVLGWTAASAVGAAAGGRFYPHYYIQLVPPLAVLAAGLYRQSGASSATSWPWWLRRRTLGSMLVIASVVFFTLHRVGLLRVAPPSEAGRYVMEHSSFEQRLFVWGQAPKVYLDARRRPASRYIATFPLTGYIFGSPLDVDTTSRILPGAWANLETDFAAHPPAFIVDTEVAVGAHYPMAAFPYLAQLVGGRFRLVATFADAAVYQRVE